MKHHYLFRILIIFSVGFLQQPLGSQTICNNNGDLIIFSNYDGGTLTINVDQNIPNLKIGVCSYEGVIINLTGPFVSNVVAVRYAGYNGSNPHCNNNVINTVINGAPASATTSILITPAVTLTDPNGYTSMVCGTGCSASGGGCNSPDQIVHYFLSSFPASTLIAHKIQYNCWTGTQSVSAGGNCCPPIPVIPGGIAASQTICAGAVPAAFTSTGAATGGSGAITYTWQASTTSASSGFTNISGANALTYAAGALSSTTYYRRAASTATNNIAYSNVIAVTVNPSPNLVISGGTGVCPNGTLTLTATGASGYTWMPGNTNSPQLPVTSSGAGTYTLYGALGTCTASAVKQVSVHPASTVTVSGPLAVCAGSSAVLTAAGALVYLWSPGGFSGSAVTVTPTGLTTYTVTGYDLNSCMINSTFILGVDPLPAIAAVPSKSVTCKGEQEIISFTGGSTYTLNPGNQQGNPIVITPSITTVFTVTGKDLNGCSSKHLFTITVVPKPVITMSLLTQPVCSGQPAGISASGAVNYTWLPGNTTGASATIAPIANAIYSVTGEDINCSNSATLAVNVVFGPILTVSSTRPRICQGEATRLQVSGGTTYTWTGSGINTLTVAVSPTITSNYSVASTGTNGCRSEAAITVSVSTCSGIIESSAINPRLNVFPNPNDGNFTVTADSPAKLELIDAAGRSILFIVLTEANRYSETIYRLADGIYFLRSSDGSIAEKVVISK